MRRTFQATAESVAAARQFVQEAMTTWGVNERDPAFPLVADVLLVVSELTTNAVKSRSDRLVLGVAAHRQHIEIAVEDEDPTPASSRPASDQGGRGLRIVEAVTTEWGQRDHDGSTKRVWGRFPVPPSSVLGEGCEL